MGFPPLYAGLLGVTAAQRLAELAWSRRNLRRQARSPGVAAASRRAFAGMVALHAGLIVLPGLEVLWRGRGAPAALAVPAGLAWGLAQALRYWSLQALGTAWNVRAVVSSEAGIVSRGPYRWIRHPNYLAVILEFLAIPAAGGAWIALLALNLAHAPVLARRIRAEERLLFRIPGYREQMGGKGRFLPRRR
ncbi:MAG: hypothetical protein EYC70_16075 [Planctomycetota bacterium]|nr:MAG: hypothetical protein EYC70_16075 [Planctomycetota bacterium]